MIEDLIPTLWRLVQDGLSIDKLPEEYREKVEAYKPPEVVEEPVLNSIAIHSKKVKYSDKIAVTTAELFADHETPVNPIYELSRVENVYRRFPPDTSVSIVGTDDGFEVILTDEPLALEGTLLRVDVTAKADNYYDSKFTLYIIA